MRLLSFSRFVIRDKSMEPAFLEGDHVVTANWIKPKIGDVVVFRANGQNLIKRVEKIVDEKIFVQGDNRKLSSKIGSVEAFQIVGKVILKY